MDDINESIYENLFEANFSHLKGLKEPEYELLKNSFRSIDKEYITFDLFEMNGKIQPLELVLKLITNKIVGNLTIDLHNKDGLILGKIRFKNFVFKKIEDLINFDFLNEDKIKELKVSYEYDEIIYTGKDGKEGKI